MAQWCHVPSRAATAKLLPFDIPRQRLMPFYMLYRFDAISLISPLRHFFRPKQWVRTIS